MAYTWQDTALRDDFHTRFERHYQSLAKRGHPVSAELALPVGQAANWYWELVSAGAPPSASHVARQLARLCGEDFSVILPWRSLVDAVGRCDEAGRQTAYVQRGVQALVDAGWLEVVTTGQGRAAETRWTITAGAANRWRADLLEVDTPRAAA